MAQYKPEYVELPDYAQMAEKLIDKFPEKFSDIDAKTLIAYAITNKDKPEGKAKPYEIAGEPEPMSFTNSKRYFVKFYMNEWESKTEEQKLWLVYSALRRIDPANPGKILPYDLHDQIELVSTCGVGWEEKDNLPHLLKDDVVFKE